MFKIVCKTFEKLSIMKKIIALKCLVCRYVYASEI